MEGMTRTSRANQPTTHYRLSFVAEVVAVVTVVLSLPSIVALTRQAQLRVVLNTIGIESDCCC